MQHGYSRSDPRRRERVARAEQTTVGHGMLAIRCDHDGLKMAEIKDGHLILRVRHHGETHIKIVALKELGREGKKSGLGVRDNNTK